MAMASSSSSPSTWALSSPISLLRNSQRSYSRSPSFHQHRHRHRHHSAIFIRAAGSKCNRSKSGGGGRDIPDESKEKGSRSIKGVERAVTAAVAAAILLSTDGRVEMAMAETGGFYAYYGTAASASSYGGFGGNASKKDTAEYVYDVPEGWKERLISKVEKGTNGTDSEFFNPRRRAQKVYLTFLSGFSRLSPRDTVLANLALSDVNLQDVIASASSILATDRTDPSSGQLYYDFEIDSPVSHSLISVTCANKKLYALFVNSPPANWDSDAPVLRHIHDSFTTVVAPRRL